jgi:hypothetical protein
MVEYAPIGDLVKKIPDDIWNTLKEMYARRPALMVGELLAIAKLRDLQETTEPENRTLAAHALDPRHRS